jgi:hypothetical protein
LRAYEIEEKMNKEETTIFIINELARHRDRNDIILELCRQLNIEWKDAEKLVKDVESQHGKIVAKKQSPFLLVLGAVILIAGIVLTLNGALYFLGFVQTDTVDQVLSARSAFIRAGSLLTGLGMITGGIIGFWKTFAEFLG